VFGAGYGVFGAEHIGTGLLGSHRSVHFIWLDELYGVRGHSDLLYCVIRPTTLGEPYESGLSARCLAGSDRTIVRPTCTSPCVGLDGLGQDLSYGPCSLGCLAGAESHDLRTEPLQDSRLWFRTVS